MRPDQLNRDPIEGFCVEFTSKELVTHLNNLAQFNSAYSDRLMYLLEAKMSGTKPEVATMVRETSKYRKGEARNWAAIAEKVPENEVFRFRPSQYGCVPEIHWPLPEENTDNEIIAAFEKAAVEPPNPLVAILGGGGRGGGGIVGGGTPDDGDDGGD